MTIRERLEQLAANVRVARASDRVFRDECMFSFDSAFSPSGLYTNLMSLESFGEPMLRLDRNAHNALYLHQYHTRKKKADVNDEDGNGAKAAPTKLAIGGEGGFAASEDDKYEIIKEHHLVLFPNGVQSSTAQEQKQVIPLVSADIPVRIQECVDALLNHAGNKVEESATVWQEELKESRYADDLIQVPDAPKISSNPNAWKCQAPDCDKQENLWLNLSDGFIGCGRKNWDGSGGCGAALRHYEETGSRYPLAVKLGTITAEGGDVFSYAPDEDDLVINKHLARHLTHFGININNMKKTDKSMTELQVELNNSYEFDKITEAGKKLVPVSGAGYIGFKNLGNSCYMNSVMQVLLSLPEIERRYYKAAESIFQTCSGCPADDFAAQMAKLAIGVLEDRYARPVCEPKNDEADTQVIEIRPTTFRALVGKNHPEFATGQQQDAVEYMQYLLEFMAKNERTASGRIGRLLATDDSTDNEIPTSNMFQFAFEDRVQCLTSKKVKYVTRDDAFLQLQIPLDAATNATQVKEYQILEQKRQRLDDDKAGMPEKVVPNIPFEACLERTMAPELIEDFLSPATGQKGLAEKRTRFKSFPRYLLVQMRRFYVDEDWTPKKLDVNVPVPEFVSLSKYLSTGLQENEEMMPDDASATEGGSQSSTSVDDSLVAQLVSMGFSENGCKRAAIATGNASAEAAMEWILTHMEDPDFNDPPNTSQPSPSTEAFNFEHVSALSAMGFSEEQAQCALSQAGHDPDRAGEWLFSHMDNLDEAVAQWKASAQGSGESKQENRLDNAHGDYSLVGFISHIGKNTNSGHYVCHLKKEGRWVIFNDEKVALSEDPPLSAGYLYLFERSDVRDNRK